MLVLALDTSTDAVVVGLVSVGSGGHGRDPEVLVERVHHGARRHGEQLVPAVVELCEAAGVTPAGLDAVICGVGPGPFTVLRVGIVSASALADALELPAYGVCSLDAVAAVAPVPAHEPLLVVSDARRREVYWAVYAGGRRSDGPAVDTPAAVAQRLPGLGVRHVAGSAAAAHAELFDLPTLPVGSPSCAGLVAVAVPALRSGGRPAPLEPLYLRRPDAVPPAARKRVTLG